MENINNLKIRKLTPKECFRLMGVKDEDFDKIEKNQSDSSLYHLAGDSIVTTVLMGIFGELLGIDYSTKINQLVESLVCTKKSANGNTVHQICRWQATAAARNKKKNAWFIQ